MCKNEWVYDGINGPNTCKGELINGRKDGQQMNAWMLRVDVERNAWILQLVLVETHRRRLLLVSEAMRRQTPPTNKEMHCYKHKLFTREKNACFLWMLNVWIMNKLTSSWLNR